MIALGVHSNLSLSGDTGGGDFVVPLREWERDLFDSQITNYAAFVGFTILVWDHIITFPDEVRYIWKGRKSFLVFLFLINRYFTPLGFIGNLVAYLSNWDPAVCKHFVRYEGATVMIAIEISALMMFQRVKALYTGYSKVTIGVALILVLVTAVQAWLLTHGQPVQHSPVVHSCSMIFDPNLRFLPSLSAWLPLIYDTIVIGLTLSRCLKIGHVPTSSDAPGSTELPVPHLRNGRGGISDSETGLDLKDDRSGSEVVKTGAYRVKQPKPERKASHIVRTLVKDGLMYYSVIFGVNLVLAVMIVAASDGIKNIAAQLEQMLTVAMMSRITLSLRREADRLRVGGSRSMMSMSIPANGSPPRGDLPSLNCAGHPDLHLNAPNQGRGRYSSSFGTVDTEVKDWEILSGSRRPSTSGSGSGGQGQEELGRQRRSISESLSEYEDALEGLGASTSFEFERQELENARYLEHAKGEGESLKGVRIKSNIPSPTEIRTQPSEHSHADNVLGTADIHFESRSIPSTRSATPNSSRTKSRRTLTPSVSSSRPTTPPSRRTTMRPSSTSIAEGWSRFVQSIQQTGGGELTQSEVVVHELRKLKASPV